MPRRAVLIVTLNLGAEHNNVIIVEFRVLRKGDLRLRRRQHEHVHNVILLRARELIVTVELIR